MKIYWLKARCKEVSFVNRPAIDKRFIAIKTMEDEDDKNKSFVDRIGNKIKDKLGLVETKIGRVLSKSNEGKLLTAADDIVKGAEAVKAVLLTVQKNNKKEDREMEEKEVKKIVEDAIDEKLDAFKTSLDEKLEELLSKKEEDSEEDEEEEDEDSEDEEEEDEEDDSEDEDSDDEEEDSEKDKKSKKKVSKKKESKDDTLISAISEIVDKKFEEVKSEVEGIKKELKIKPVSDKKKEKKEKKKDDENDDADYTGAFGLKNA